MLSKRWLDRQPFNESRERVLCLSRKAAGLPNQGPLEDRAACSSGLHNLRFEGPGALAPRGCLSVAGTSPSAASPRRDDFYLEPLLRRMKLRLDAATATWGLCFAEWSFVSSQWLQREASAPQSAASL